MNFRGLIFEVLYRLAALEGFRNDSSMVRIDLLQWCCTHRCRAVQSSVLPDLECAGPWCEENWLYFVHASCMSV